MDSVAKACVGLAAVSFLAAGVVTLTGGDLVGITAEGFSRASSNLALLALGLFIGFKGNGASS